MGAELGHLFPWRQHFVIIGSLIKVIEGSYWDEGILLELIATKSCGLALRFGLGTIYKSFSEF